MSNFMITTDSNADLPADFAQAHGIAIMSLTCEMDGNSYDEENPIDNKWFYERMRAGALPITSQVTPEGAREVYEKALATTNQVLHIGFSSGLSGSYQSAAFAAREILEEQSDKKIIAVDSLGASMGVALLVYYAVQLREAGKTLEETAAWLEENKSKVCTCVSVDDLFHLCRGGRVSKTSAVLGTAIGIKPMLTIDAEGKLAPYAKMRGRKRALAAMVDQMREKVGTCQNEMVCISHCDAEEDALTVRDMIAAEFGVKNFMLNFICPTIGAHAGPGTVALFYMGDA